jgi:hypothetical protein
MLSRGGPSSDALLFLLSLLQFDAARGPSLVRLVVDRAVEVLAGMCELPTDKAMALPDITVGLEARAAEIVQRLTSGGTSRMLLLHGMAGMGKTTLAKAVFNRLHRMDRTVPCHFARLNPEMTDPRDVMREQRVLMEELAPAFGSAAAGGQTLEGRLRGKKVLLVVDNAWRAQLALLLPGNIMHVLGKGSMVLVTSRESWDVGVQLEEARFLTPAESLQLFCRHVYGQDHCPPDDAVPVNAIVARCGGLPLALEVVGRHLRGTRDVWSFFRRLESELAFVYSHQQACRFERQQTVLDALSVSWVALDDEQKSTLLDVVWFLRGQPLQLVASFCDPGVLARLNRLGLVKWSAEGASGQQLVTVHNVVVDFCKMLPEGDHGRRLDLQGSVGTRRTVKRVLSRVGFVCRAIGWSCWHVRT